jgi:hypothetical protein
MGADLMRAEVNLLNPKLQTMSVLLAAPQRFRIRHHLLKGQ